MIDNKKLLGNDNDIFQIKEVLEKSLDNKWTQEFVYLLRKFFYIEYWSNVEKNERYTIQMIQEVLKKHLDFLDEDRGTEEVMRKFRAMLPYLQQLVISDMKQLKFIRNKLYEYCDHSSYEGVEIIRDMIKTGKISQEKPLPIVFTSMLFGNLPNLSEMDVVYSQSQTSQVSLDNQTYKLEDGGLIVWDFIKKIYPETMVEGKSDAEKIEYSYAEYIQNISNQKNSESYEEDKAYWLNKIDSLSSYPQIPMKMKLADCRDYNIVRKSAIIDSVLWGNFKETARRHKVSPSALLCTLYGRIMAKWGNQSEVLLNLTVFQRQQKNTEKIIGDFTKLLPLNLVFAKEDIWKSAERVQEQIMKELDHLSFDGTEIMRELAKRRGVFGKALLPVVFTCVLFDCPENYFERLGSIKYAVSQTPQVFLDNQITEMGGRLHISWDVVDELFEACIIDEIFLEFVEDIKRISENNKANSTNDFVTKVWGNILTKEIITKSVVPDLLKNIDLKQIKILDYAQELCPPDVKGQVYVSESEIMNDRNKTYYKILEHPLYGRMADTGIIGVLTHDGYMEFVVPNCETSVETPDKKEDTHEEEIEKPIVKEIMKIWKEVFEIEDISIQDDFYTLGGDSIILMRLVDEMCKTLGCDVTVDDILQSENISDLANRV